MLRTKFEMVARMYVCNPPRSSSDDMASESSRIEEFTPRQEPSDFFIRCRIHELGHVAPRFGSANEALCESRADHSDSGSFRVEVEDRARRRQLRQPPDLLEVLPGEGPQKIRR